MSHDELSIWLYFASRSRVMQRTCDDYQLEPNFKTVNYKKYQLLSYIFK